MIDRAWSIDPSLSVLPGGSGKSSEEYGECCPIDESSAFPSGSASSCPVRCSSNVLSRMLMCESSVSVLSKGCPSLLERDGVAHGTGSGCLC